MTVAPNLSEWDGAYDDAAPLAALLEGQDLFVNDDFQHSSMSLSSIIGPPSLLPSAAGRQLQADVELLLPLLTAPDRPLVVVLGSRDTLDRISNLYSLMLRADAVLVGGQMSQPFLAAIGRQPPGDDSLEFLEECRHAYGVGHTIRHPIHLPSDLVWERPDGSVTTVDELQPVDGSIGDIGPRTGLKFADTLRGAGTIVWAGSLGKVEEPRFAEGTLALGRALTDSDARVVLGGDALLSTLAEHRLLPESAGILSATGSAIAFLKDGDLPGSHRPAAGVECPGPGRACDPSPTGLTPDGRDATAHSVRLGRASFSITVPQVPRSRSAASSSRPIMAGFPVASTKRQAASTLGPIDPAGNDMARRAAVVVRPMGCAASVPKPVSTLATSVRISSASASRSRASSAARQVLVDDRLGPAERPVAAPDDRDAAAAGADRPRRRRASSVRMVGSSTMARGSGEATTRRHEVPSGRTCQPRRRGQALGLVLGVDRARRTWSGASKAGSSAATSVWQIRLTTSRPGRAFSNAWSRK